MRQLIGIIIVVVLIFAAGSAFAGFIDFENGTEGMIIFSSITGLEFTNTAGYDWRYGDWRTNSYNGPYPNYAITWQYPLATQYYSDGNFFAWMGTDQGTGVITFTQSYATYFKVGYSTASGITLTAFDDQGAQLDIAFGVSDNLGTGRLDFIQVDAPGMKYVTLNGTNNQWLIDNLETDAIQECTLDEHCDDGVFCNGQETCFEYQCQANDPIDCSDDGIFCNGTESCSEEDQACVHSGDPCAPDECDEQNDSCPEDVEDDDDDDEEPDTGLEDDDDDLPEEGEDEDLWPEGKVTGGCGC